MFKNTNNVVVTWYDVFGRSESTEPLLKYEYSKWIARCDQCIDSQIKFESIDEERL